MCGLIGAAGNLFANDIKVTKQLLFVDQLRGAHSTGIFTHNEKEGCYYFKEALPAADFLQLGVVQGLIDTKQAVIAGHNRYATVGAINNDTAHPFIHGDIVMMHNGTLTTRAGLSTTRPEVDSEHIALTMSEVDEPNDVLEKLDGAFALVWFNTAEKTLNFARNKDRELYFAFAKDKFFWCSEEKALDWVLDRNSIVNCTIEKLPVGKHWKFKVDNRGYTKEEFDFEPKKQASYSVGYYGNGWQHGYGKTLHELGFYMGQSIDFVVSKFEPYSSTALASANPTGILYGMDVDTDTPVVMYGVTRNDIALLANSKPDADVVYNATARGISTPTGRTREHIALDHISLSMYGDDESEAILSITSAGEDDHIIKKLPVSSTDVVVADTAVTREEMEILCQIGCSFCGHPFSEEEIKTALVIGDGLMHSGACHSAYLEMVA